MNTPLSDAKEIRIPGPDHPITISPVADITEYLAFYLTRVAAIEVIS